MRKQRILQKSALGLICLSIAACSSGTGNDVTAVGIAKGIVGGLFDGNKPSGPDVNAVSQQAAKALASTSGQVIVVAIPQSDALSVMQEIERNGPYVTIGTATRQSITLKNGIMTSSRGLGEDLMSSETNAVQGLIAKRATGSAPRINRFLDGENLTVSQQLFCNVNPRSQGRLTMGVIDTPVTKVTESCLSDDLVFTNTYQVTPGGRVVQSRQWHSPLNDYIAIQSLR